ncbi:MAG TPA: AMMECR1 domain-containing protein [Clostridiaceae bacterium]|nr:AMMECR1 domain-containing protein [Clostridiaceae bacterium]
MGKLLKSYIMPHPPIMVHEIGKGDEIEIENTINSALAVAEEIEDMKPQTIVILVPPHGPSFGDAMSINTDEVLEGDFSNFGARDVKFEIENDLKLTDIIMGKCAQNGIPVAPIDINISQKYRIPNKLDHGSMVPLYFVSKKYTDFKLVHITYGMLSNEELYKFGRLVRDAIEQSSINAVYIASGDLSHRLKLGAPAGFSPRGKEFDEKIVSLLKKPDVDGIMDMDTELVESAGECGYRSIITAMGTLDGVDVNGKVFSYEGPFGVGYCIAGYTPIGKNEGKDNLKRYLDKKKDKLAERRSHEDEFVKLARESLEYYIKKGKTMPTPDDIPDDMKRKAGVFVSLKKNGQLRGCIGTIEGVQQNIAEEIIENAISAGTRDPRFYPVEKDELDDLVYSVDVLGKSEPVSSREELDASKYGVIVRSDWRSGLLLPNLEGVDTVDEQISIALKKAGIDEDEDYSIERFEVVRHK